MSFRLWPDGPHRDKPGFGSIGEAIGGIRYITGEAGSPAVRPNISLGDSVAGLYAVVGALMATHARDVQGSGVGQVVDVALYEAVFSLMESPLPEYDIAGIVRECAGTSLPGISPSNTYRSSDGSYIVIGGNSDAIFRRLMKAIGRPDMADDSHYRTNADRAAHADELDNLIENWTSKQPLQEILRILDEAQVPAGPIYSIADIMNDPQYRMRDMILQSTIEGIGSVAMPGLIPKLSETPGEVKGYGGAPGTDNEEIYVERLGLSEHELNRLAAEGAI